VYSVQSLTFKVLQEEGLADRIDDFISLVTCLDPGLEENDLVEGMEREIYKRDRKIYYDWHHTGQIRGPAGSFEEWLLKYSASSR
jgi:hypothetical protein